MCNARLVRQTTLDRATKRSFIGRRHEILARCKRDREEERGGEEGGGKIRGSRKIALRGFLLNINAARYVSHFALVRGAFFRKALSFCSCKHAPCSYSLPLRRLFSHLPSLAASTIPPSRVIFDKKKKMLLRTYMRTENRCC